MKTRRKEASVLGFLKKNDRPCQLLRANLEEIGDRSLPPALAEHAGACQECRTALEDFAASRVLLSALPRQRAEAKPWFAARVMAAIAERESKLQRSLEAWTAVPKLASRIAWISAVALLLTTSWLIEQRPPKKLVVTDLAGESMIDSHPTPANNDEVLLSLTERME
jgi:hypothetical protein